MYFDIDLTLNPTFNPISDFHPAFSQKISLINFRIFARTVVKMKEIAKHSWRFFMDFRLRLHIVANFKFRENGKMYLNLNPSTAACSDRQTIKMAEKRA